MRRTNGTLSLKRLSPKSCRSDGHFSFQVMRRLGINEAFTNDKHFEAAGFAVLF